MKKIQAKSICIYVYAYDVYVHVCVCMYMYMCMYVTSALRKSPPMSWHVLLFCLVKWVQILKIQHHVEDLATTTKIEDTRFSCVSIFFSQNVVIFICDYPLFSATWLREPKIWVVYSSQVNLNLCGVSAYYRLLWHTQSAFKFQYRNFKYDFFPSSWITGLLKQTENRTHLRSQKTQ